MMLDRTKPFGEVFKSGRSTGFVQDGRLFDHDGKPVLPVEEPAPPKRRGRPPKSQPETE